MMKQEEGGRVREQAQWPIWRVSLDTEEGKAIRG